jgi:transposase-like protein
MARTRHTYTPEFKTEQGFSVAEAACSLGLNENLIRPWKHAFEAKGTDAFPSRQRTNCATPSHKAARPQIHQRGPAGTMNLVLCRRYIPFARARRVSAAEVAVGPSMTRRALNGGR